MAYLLTKSPPNYPKCPKHAEKKCELHCEKCDIPVCSTCVSSGKHKGHDISDILRKISTKTQHLQNDLEELETRIFPRYEKMASDIRTEKAELETNYGKLTNDANQRGEILYREVTAIVNRRRSDIQEMKNKHLSILTENTDEITRKITELKHIISDLKSILKSNDVSLTSTYKSRISEFRTLPPKVQVTLPSFSPGKINKDQLNEMFASLSSLSLNTEYGEILKSPGAESSPPVKQLLDEPRVTATTDTAYQYGLYGVRCLGEEKIWTSGADKIMKLINLQGKLLTTIKTKSGNVPQDITVTQDGDLVYTDANKQTVNLVKNNKISTLITLLGWEPYNVCSTASGDLLVTMLTPDGTQSKVMRYSGATPTQTIQFDDQGRPLYLPDCYIYISENRNMNICVADYNAKAIVVVNQSGKLRFRYTAESSFTKEPFRPMGITTDSQSHILTADKENHIIHILDQDGQFLRYIEHCDLRDPWGLSVDNRDNLFVAEYLTYKVKTIQYLST